MLAVSFAIATIAFLFVEHPDALGPSAALAQPGGQDNAIAARESARGNELTLVEFVTRVDQNGADAVSYGFLTHVHGVDDADLFAGSPEESNARYTFVTTATLAGRFVIGNVFNLISNAATTYYRREPPIQSDCVSAAPTMCPDPAATFSAGTAFATASGRYSDTNDVIAPDTGVISGTGEAALQTVKFRELNLRRFPLWKPGLKIRVTYFGSAVRTDPVPPVSFSLLVARGTVIH
jgi:hypothetical protein